jgi:IS5 family transposase
MEQQTKGLTLADGILAELGGPRTAGLLERLDAATPWEGLAAVVRPLYRNNSARGGRPNIPAVVMLKITLMQRWFGLSDPAMEEAILDRLSFRRFLGLGTADGTVDHATIALFRKLLHDEGLASELFEIVNAHLREQGLIVQEGTAVDATIIEAHTGRPRKRDDLESSRDRAATHTKKHGRVYFGYKAHVASDAGALIVDYRLDTSKVHDINYFEELTEEETVATWADSAYRSKEHQQRIEGQGAFFGVIHPRVRGQAKLTAQQKAHNKLYASFRGVCEMPFAWMRRAGRKWTRYRGLRKTATDFGLWATSYNLWRSLSVRPA